MITLSTVKPVDQNPDFSTPWRRVYSKFGMKTQSAFARAINRHRSKISRALNDSEGLISGRDQKHLLAVAKSLKIVLRANDFVPGGK